MTAPGVLCGCGCGRPAVRAGYADHCYRRWRAAGCPESGPPAPLPPGVKYRDIDPYDALWLAGEPERRVARAKAPAADLVRCVAARDAEGVRLLLHRVTDWPALSVVLAECADPVRTAAVTGRQQDRGAA